MPPKRKAATKAPSKAAGGKKSTTAAAVAREAKKLVEREALVRWIAENDPLLDRAAEHPITLDDLFTRIVTKKTFAHPTGGGQTPYDWSVLRAVLEARDATSPRWFAQMREEDLLAGADGLEGVTVNCFVIAEASEPTLCPAEYVVKVHWPYSDQEDNAPERVLPIAGQNMCWRRVVRSGDGADINMYLLQKRETTGGGAPAVSAALFGFGAAPAPPASTAAASTAAAPVAPGAFGFGFGATTTAVAAAPATAVAPAGFGFGFGTTATTAAVPANFGFGAPPTAPAATAAPAAAFSFGSAALTTGAPAPAPAPTAAAAPANNDDGSVKLQPLLTSEVLFCLWSRKRLNSMASEVKSGSRIVREKFPLDATKSIKLVMENDRKDKAPETARRLILNRLFARSDEDVVEVDKWISSCPVYDEGLTAALQRFREQHLEEVAAESDNFEKLFAAHHGKITAELERIVSIRAKAAHKELAEIEDITARIKENKLAEKASFRLLKYYPKNDVQRFRPFGKVSGISEMGEGVDVCVPPAHVNINPFTNMPS